MAWSASTVGEIRSAGATTNGGYYDSTVSGATNDYSQQNAAQYNLTGGTTAAANAIILHASAAADMVGNGLMLASGTNATVDWYIVQSVVVGVSITVDRNCTSAAGASLAFKVGGAFAFGGSNEDLFFEKAVPGLTYYIKQGTHSQGASVAVSTAGNGSATLKVRLIGYAVTRGDNPSIASGTQPIMSCAGTSQTFATHWELSYLTQTGTAATNLQLNGVYFMNSCKVSNTSGTANRIALNGGTSNGMILNCDLSSTAGYAAVTPNCNGATFYNNWIHDSVSGFRPSGAISGIMTFIGNIVSNITTAAVDLSAGAFTGQLLLLNNTYYGAASPTGSSSGLSFAASSGGINMINDIFYGFVTGANGAGAITAALAMNNCFFNNTTARTNWPVGSGDVALDPQFVAAGSNNYAIGTNLKALGNSSTFPSGLTPNYEDIGAAQRREPVPSKVNGSRVGN